MSRIAVVISLFFIINLCHSQSILDVSVKELTNSKKLVEYFTELEKQYPIKFYYQKDWIDGFILQKNDEGKSLRTILSELFLDSKLNFIELNQHTIIIVTDTDQALQRVAMLNEARREQKKIDQIVIGTRDGTTFSKLVTLTGKVEDAKSKIPLAGVSVQSSDNNSKAITDDKGEFTLQIPAGSYAFKLNYVNYEEKTVDVEINQNGFLTFQLEEIPIYLENVIIQDLASRELVTSEIGLVQLNLKELKRAPALLGEVDIIKQIQLLPGVTSVGEAASGFNVRGGGVDQNLILYDGLPVFNSAHLFGFFSSFNAEAIRDVSFYRGGIPAEYGGRSSSILDIRSKEGDLEKWKFQGGIGLISSSLSANGPIVKSKNSLALSLRTTYSNWLLKAIPTDYVNLSSTSASFYDGTLKFTHIFSKKTKFNISIYKSHDQFSLSGDSTFRWNTTLGSARIDHEFNKTISGALTLGLGEYTYKLSSSDPVTGFNLNYKVTYPTTKLEFLVVKNQYKLSFGFQGMLYQFNPGTLTPGSPDSNKPFIDIEDQHAFESGLFIANQIKVGHRIALDAGIRLSGFAQTGPGNVYIYNQNSTKDIQNVVDTLTFKKGQSMKSFNNFEPRAGLRFELSPKSSIKAGYHRLYQYLHLVTNTTAITPVDIWQPSGYYFKPQQADQISLGYFQDFKEKNYDAFVEVYYKKINNVLDFKDGAQLILNPHIETDLLQGSIEAYGVESQISKKNGKLTGSISYTFSRSFLTLNGQFPEEIINNGLAFPSNFDQPHVINLNWSHRASKRIYFTGGFTYHTGRPISLPLSAFYVGNNTVSSFSERNQYRIPDYHRLDLGLVVEGSHKRKKLFDGTWTFSVYNIYARRNPYTVFFKEVRPGIFRPYRLSIIGTALPSITYNLKF
ncbi:MAG: TonB-dependent receptor [Cyclobacteriaceae bacterium]|nr:TonB-dependent receptor [Cyclobacteriaceae bacterium]UYN86495.1 MAG: TonB-dependent receptor [Cyclobacteriaceae bacterium]